jgi:hypothetical protein
MAGELYRLHDLYLAFSFYPQKEENIQGSQVKPKQQGPSKTETGSAGKLGLGSQVKQVGVCR